MSGDVREVKKRSPPPQATCVSCRVTQVLIGGQPDWINMGGTYICGKDACRAYVGVQRFVPPDEPVREREREKE
jgi:hypothetical protein